MRRCLLHIGTHKTGTTSIQIALNSRRDVLARHGYLYPKTGIPPGLAGQHNVAWQLRGDRRFNPDFGTLDDLLLEIDGSELDVLLSSEDFECAVGNLRYLIRALEQHDLKVEIIIYVRDQISYARSLYLELLSHGCNRTAGEFLLDIVNDHVFRWQDWVFAFDYRALLGQLPPATSVIARHRTESVTGDFVSILGKSPADLQIDVDFWANRQKPTSEAVISFYRNRSLRQLSEEDRVSIMPMVAQTFDAVKVDISPRDKEKLIAAFDASNRWMDARYGLPVLTDMARDTNGAGYSPSAQLDMDMVFSTSTLDLIDELRQSRVPTSNR